MEHKHTCTASPKEGIIIIYWGPTTCMRHVEVLIRESLVATVQANAGRSSNMLPHPSIETTDW